MKERAKAIARNILYSLLFVAIMAAIAGSGYGGFIVGYDRGILDAQKEAIKQGVAFHDAYTGEIKWGVREAQSIAVALEPIGKAKK